MPLPQLPLEQISIDELREQWPKSDDGKLAARLLQRYGYSLLIESSLGAECTEDRAQAESAANKAIAKMVKDFAVLAVPIQERKPRKPMQPLHRFQQPEKNSTEK